MKPAYLSFENFRILKEITYLCWDFTHPDDIVRYGTLLVAMIPASRVDAAVGKAEDGIELS